MITYLKFKYKNGTEESYKINTEDSDVKNSLLGTVSVINTAIRDGCTGVTRLKHNNKHPLDGFVFINLKEIVSLDITGDLSFMQEDE